MKIRKITFIGKAKDLPKFIAQKIKEEQANEKNN